MHITGNFAEKFMEFDLGVNGVVYVDGRGGNGGCGGGGGQGGWGGNLNKHI
jgi:hypothetical protein